MTRSLQGFLKELLGRSRVPLSGKPEVDRGASGIDGTVQVPPAPTLANVRFVDPPGAVGWFQFPPASLVQFGCVALHPAPNGGVVSKETSLHEQFLDVPIRKREPQIPTDRANNDLGFEVPPFEQRWPRFDHGIYCSLSDWFAEFLQHNRISPLALLVTTVFWTVLWGPAGLILALRSEGREIFDRCALFLRTDLEYQWPKDNFVGIGGLGPVGRILTLGLSVFFDRALRRREEQRLTELRVVGPNATWPLRQRVLHCAYDLSLG